MDKDMELNLGELDNVFGTGNREFDEEKALENPGPYRQELIEKLREERDKLKDLGSYQEPGRRGR